jgi:hypothetical protein
MTVRNHDDDQRKCCNCYADGRVFSYVSIAASPPQYRIRRRITAESSNRQFRCIRIEPEHRKV